MKLERSALHQLFEDVVMVLQAAAYVSIRQHTPAYVEYERLAVAQLSASRSSGRELKPAVALTKAAAQREPLFWM
jgi:hypothetical protein